MLKYHLKMDIKKVFDSYDEELRLVEAKLREIFKSDVVFIPLIGRYLLEGGGKRIRPLFLLTSARLLGYKGDGHITLAGVIECIHTASLLHDDVVDGAELRRGQPAAHSLWGNQVVILVGDYLYSNALRTAVSLNSHKIMEAVSGATTRMTEGEIFQLEKSGDIKMTEEEYLRIISAKTAGLISAACRMAAALAGRPPEDEEALAAFGLKSGMAFQMADDILDYMAEEEGLGKKLGKDLDEGKITLPLIYLLSSASKDEKEEIGSIIDNGLSNEGLKRMLGLFEKYSVLEESMKKAEKLISEAKEELMIFSPSHEREEMFALADYALQRDK
jgi:octaprenyl-diphosphate synthase